MANWREWIDDEPDRFGAYQMSFVPLASGSFHLHVWVEASIFGRGSAEEYLPGSPFTLNVNANASDQVTHEVVDVSGTRAAATGRT